MNIVTIIIVLSLLEELPELPEYSRANHRTATERACIRRRNTARAAIGDYLEEGKIIGDPYEPDFDIVGSTNIYGRTTKQWRGKVSHKWDTFYFKTRSYIDTGRVHNGDKKRKGKRPYSEEKLDKIRFQQALEDYLDS